MILGHKAVVAGYMALAVTPALGAVPSRSLDRSLGCENADQSVRVAIIAGKSEVTGIAIERDPQTGKHILTSLRRIEEIYLGTPGTFLFDDGFGTFVLEANGGPATLTLDPPDIGESKRITGLICK
jgi:hypothetical protein